MFTQVRMFSDKKEASSSAKEETKATEEKKVDPKSQKKEEDKKDKKAASKDETTTSSSDDEGTAESLSKADVDKIKKLIAEQDKEIEVLKEQVKQYKEKLIYQLAENDNTVKRYKKEIDSTREFAISKFAKDLLDVRDNLQMGYDFTEKIKLDDIKDLEELKKSFIEVKKGMSMTEHVMDACLKRFGVV